MEGELKGFTPYWKFTDSVLLSNPDTTKWVWNSASSLYNKKGLEIENYDPLGRYNSGIYGYNSTLPIAVIQNSRYREVLYDGFEDYNYKTNNCSTCDIPREYDFVKGNSGVSLAQNESHTGKYSVKVNAGSEAKITVPVVTQLQNDTTSQNVSMPVDSAAVYATAVFGKGKGLTGTYKSVKFLGFCGDNTTVTVNEDGALSYYWSGNPPQSGICPLSYDVIWKGKLQVPYTDNYKFYVESDKAISVVVNGIKCANSMTPYVETSGAWISLQAGKLYSIEVRYTHLGGVNAFAKVRWAREGASSLEVIPKEFLYKDNLTTQDTVGSVKSNLQYWCVTPGSVKGGNILRSTFTPVQKSKLLVTAWIKMDGNDCNSAPALDNVVIATEYTKWGTTNTYALQRTGVRIEGWQRYEVIVPTSDISTQLKIGVVAPSGRDIYVDDIRVQPFNSSMKSFAYDPESLRLMAELDENNYATQYEYDDDGTLIRVKKETERGIMTVKESRSALLKDN
jgi:hypothetical protein